MTDERKGALLALALPLTLLAGAFGSEWLGLVACEMCWWQRWAHIGAIPPAAAAMVMRGDERGRATRAATLLAAAAILTSGLIGAYHAGIEYGWWEGHSACTSAGSASLTLEGMVRDAANALRVRCDEAQWTLLGVSLAGYNAIVSTVGACFIGGLALRGRRT